MKNIELLNICYKFFNRFITTSTLIEKLNSIDKSKLSSKDKNNMDNLISGIVEISNNTPNSEDDLVIKENEKIKRIIEKLESIKDDNEVIKNHIKGLNEDLKKEKDSKERWYKVTDYINNNDYFNKTFDSLTDYELLEFIAQYIKASFPPMLTQEEFDKLVEVGIKNDKREWLWRLAFNYDNREIKLDSIVNYFISIKDGRYLTELISAVGENLDIDKIIDEINDKELINDLKERKGVISSNVTEEQYNRLISKLDD